MRTEDSRSELESWRLGLVSAVPGISDMDEWFYQTARLSQNRQLPIAKHIHVSTLRTVATKTKMLGNSASSII